MSIPRPPTCPRNSIATTSDPSLDQTEPWHSNDKTLDLIHIRLPTDYRTSSLMIMLNRTPWVVTLTTPHLIWDGYVVVQFCPWFKFYFLLFWGMVIYDNEFETKKNKIWTKDKIEPQQIHHPSEYNRTVWFMLLFSFLLRITLFYFPMFQTHYHIQYYLASKMF